MLAIKKYTSWGDLCELQPHWNRLVAASPVPSIFMTWEWLTSWWEAYGPPRDLLVLVCFDDAMSPVGILPMYKDMSTTWPGVRFQSLRLVGDGTFDSDNLDLVVLRGQERPVIRSVLQWLYDQRSSWDVLQLNTIPSGSPNLRLIQQELREQKWACAQSESLRMVIPLPDSWDNYLNSLARKTREVLRRHLRRVERDHAVRLRRCTCASELAPALERLFELHTMRWQLRGQRGSFALPGRREFYAKIAQRFLAQGWLSFWLLDLNEQIVAAEFGFCYGGTYFALQSGFDPAFSPYAVGTVVKALILRELIGQGVGFHDFLGGDEGYKSRWGADQQQYVFLSCAAPRSRGASILRFAESAERSKEWLRARVPQPVWGFLRRTYRKWKPYHSGAKVDSVPEQDGLEPREGRQ